jgi:hypothetical protein
LSFNESYKNKKIKPNNFEVEAFEVRKWKKSNFFFWNVVGNHFEKSSEKPD